MRVERMPENSGHVPLELLKGEGQAYGSDLMKRREAMRPKTMKREGDARDGRLPERCEGFRDP